MEEKKEVADTVFRESLYKELLKKHKKITELELQFGSIASLVDKLKELEKKMECFGETQINSEIVTKLEKALSRKETHKKLDRIIFILVIILTMIFIMLLSLFALAS